MPEQKLPQELIDLSHHLADAAGDVIRRYFRSSLSVDNKSDDSPVTIADREAEKAIRAILEKERPGDGIHGEEFGSDAGTTGYLWVLDPVDGTKAFATGRPLFGTLIGLVHEDEAILGILDQPINKERWIGAKGHGTKLNDKIVKCRPCPDIKNANVATTGPDMFDMADYMRFYNFVKKETSFTLYGGDCYSYGQLAGGWLDAVVESYMKLHDYAALIPIVEGAGGIITDWHGKKLNLEAGWHTAAVVAAGDAVVHQKLCKVLAS